MEFYLFKLAVIYLAGLLLLAWLCVLHEVAEHDAEDE